MSRSYSMFVRIRDFRADREVAIKNAAENEWSFDGWLVDYDGCLAASGDSSLCGGEAEDEFALRLTKAVWATNGVYCEVEVNATCLEEVPFETYTFDENDFRLHMPSKEDVTA